MTIKTEFDGGIMFYFLDYLINRRKSRKELLQEIKDLEEEVIKQKEYKIDLHRKLDTVTSQIRTVSVSCMHNRNGYSEMQNKKIVENFLCELLAKELLPYMSIEEYVYAPIDPNFCGESKYIATLKFLE